MKLRVFHRFGQAKFSDVGTIFTNQFLLLPQLTQKNEALFKNGQIWPKNNRLVTYIISKYVKLTLEFSTIHFHFVFMKIV
jgi:hypothetical protein